ncbi:ABC transporter ATP-binding protein [Anoxynatronum buryatiense]|uniref:NitT/TauT family transport system ATP-binding protein n=1 Tax=Anoxynatronum buryatiense TaxID=489973 RepID=A0AA45WWQ4_9CLOT|nr:ABC transporter ATP-binding protein [Anoxynatronum buryatiense]SMP60326.1 NitT/TauT family transport system ATP-binding protein [Anoxynatronum buryatiense]
MIEVQRVSKVFHTEKGQRVLAVNDIQLEIDHQEFVCLVGPSGSGKSTLLRLMEGLIEPTEGQVRVLGEPVRGPRSDAAMVFQEYSLMPWRTVLDNVTFGLELRQVKRAEQKKQAMALLQRFGLQDFSQCLPYELSGGMKQRAAIARALAVSPKILYMDEPFGALDAYTRYQMQQDLIDYWVADKRTIVFVTHSVEEAVFLATRVILMSPHPGEIVADYAIDLPYPRNRWCDKFGAHFKEILQRLDEVSRQ